MNKHASIEAGVNIAMLCQAAGMTRQNYYKQRSVRLRAFVDEQLMLELIRRERSRQPHLGGRKLLHLLAPELESAGAGIGRDRFFALLKQHDLLIKRCRRAARTTQSGHGFAVYPNLARDLTLTMPHQLLVSDITYVRTVEGFMYLCLVMDAFSRMIVGYDCSDSLEMEGALRALSMALKQLPVDHGAMHHSDRGIQYCCRAYVHRLCEANMRISMTEANHCYENSQAERLNGTLKREYGLGGTFAAKAQVLPQVRQAVMLYNHHRPHQALAYAMPAQVHAVATVAAAG